jgi:hypothetical protein
MVVDRIQTCLLLHLACYRVCKVNFAPRGWSAYEEVGENVPALGRTGMPVAIQMSLSFKETNLYYKRRFHE